MTHSFWSGAARKAPLFFFSLLLATACAGAPQPGAVAADDVPHAAEPAAADLACSRDVECVLVDDCCGCARGGLRLSVRSDHLQALTERSASSCDQQTCGATKSAHRSCEATAARCLGGRCVPKL